MSVVLPIRVQGGKGGWKRMSESGGREVWYMGGTHFVSLPFWPSPPPKGAGKRVIVVAAQGIY